ncbi:hypothetical protein HHK36_018569 [Tetracentron sinense]|uniref:RING-type domain-containing protein n=1 Tax=Tetracentron sinense TaxID=13715 RepID=A0A835DE54_TETSI|nr:hypothetical protein HHK36_018569 [Tetracentron sinense]
MRKSFKDSLKALEADIQHANTLASDYRREYDGACLQLRLSYSPAAHLFLFLVQWTDCHLAGSLGFLRILIYKVNAFYYRPCIMLILLSYCRPMRMARPLCLFTKKKLVLENFMFGSLLTAVIFPSLLQLQGGITDVEDRKQRELYAARYQRKNEIDKGKVSEIDVEREEECGICMEMNSKVVLPNCNHSLCMKCYRDWRARSQSCPFCRDSLKRVNSGDLWIYTDSRDIVELSSIARENIKRLFMYIDKLPLIVPDSVFVPYDSRVM